MTGPASSLISHHDLIRQEEHTQARSHIYGQRDKINGGAQCKRNLLANKQSALLFFFNCSFFFHYISWVFPESQVGLIWLIVLPEIHPTFGPGNGGKQILRKHDSHVWVDFAGIYCSFTALSHLIVFLSVTLSLCLCLPLFFLSLKRKTLLIPQVKGVFDTSVFLSCGILRMETQNVNIWTVAPDDRE